MQSPGAGGRNVCGADTAAERSSSSAGDASTGERRRRLAASERYRLARRGSDAWRRRLQPCRGGDVGAQHDGGSV